MRKIIQIAIGTNAQDAGEFRERLYALASDGTLWRLIDPDCAEGYTDPWTELPNVPQPEPEPV
jgi:hypothetical protein